MKNHKGFTLIEMILILAVISILAAVAVPVVLRIFEQTTEDTTREEMDNIRKAILGNPAKLQSSFRSDFFKVVYHATKAGWGCADQCIRAGEGGGLPSSERQAGGSWGDRTFARNRSSQQ